MITLELPSVTLVAIGSTNIEGNIKALRYSSKGIKFGKIKFITSAIESAIHYVEGDSIEISYINPIRSIDEWNHEVIYALPRYIDTEFALLIHPDGFVVNPEAWRSEFLRYDYIGAPWPRPSDGYSYRDIGNKIIRVGNSVSLRSKRLLDLANKLNLEWKSYHGFYNEDGFICVNNRHHYMEAKMHFAPLGVAKYFSRETELSENKDVESPFAFHKHEGRNKVYPNFES